MSTYRRYQEARDAAWQALLLLPEKRLPVDAEALAREMGVEVLSRAEEKDPALLSLLRQAGTGACVSLRAQGQWRVYLRKEQLSDSQRRFSVAHELGHLFLCHPTRGLAPGVRAFESRENAGDLIEDPLSLDDYAADIFAIRLLAPACVLHELRLDQLGPITALCGLPPRAAALRAERMELLNRRDAFLPFLREYSAVRAGACPASGEFAAAALPMDEPRFVDAEPMADHAETEAAAEQALESAAYPDRAPSITPYFVLREAAPMDLYFPPEPADQDAGDEPREADAPAQSIPDPTPPDTAPEPSSRRIGPWLGVAALSLLIGVALFFFRDR